MSEKSLQFIVVGSFGDWINIKCEVCGRGIGRETLTGEHVKFVQEHSERTKHAVFRFTVKDSKQDNPN